MSDTSPAQITDPRPGAIVRTEGAEQSLEVQAETAATALAAAAEADVKAMFALSKRFPRDIMQVRKKILDACARPRFAELARYKKPLGQKWNPDTQQMEDQFARGFSIRFAEEAIRCMGNASIDIVPLWEDEEKRMLRIVATDYENVIRNSATIVVEKTIERSKPKEGQKVLGTRTNSRNKTTYILRATEDDMLGKTAGAVSKAWRTSALRLIPADLQEEAEEVIAATKAKASGGETIDERRKKCADFYGKLGIGPAKVAEYIGHPLADATPDELDTLRDLGVGIREGETTWREIMDSIKATGEPDANGEVKPPAESEAAKEIKERLEAKKAARKAAKTAAPPAAAVPPPAPATVAPPPAPTDAPAPGAPRRDPNAVILIGLAEKATDGKGIGKATQLLETYRSTLGADDIEAVEKAIRDAGARIVRA